jgi:competence protein ComFB
MSIRDRYDFSLVVNEVERLVIDEMERQLTDSDVCSCSDCVLDIATFALNQLKPYYRVSLMGSIYAQAVNDEFLKEVRDAVTRAIQKIKNNPAH